MQKQHFYLGFYLSIPVIESSFLKKHLRHKAKNVNIGFSQCQIESLISLRLALHFTTTFLDKTF